MLEALKFLIVGPLISIYRELVEIKELLTKIRRHQVTSYNELADQLTSLGNQVDSIKTELGSDITRLQEIIANSENVPTAVIDAANGLAAKINSLQQLDVPNPEPESPAEPETPSEPSTPETPVDPETPPAEDDSEDGSDQFA